jgi:predicted RNase H-like nuclease
MEARVAIQIRDVLLWKPQPKVVGIDVPIGLLDSAVNGGRECDVEARKLLGQPRGTSVLSPPSRRALKARTPEEAHEWNKSSGPHAPGLPLQARAIIPKIHEVDELITPSLQRRIVEVHPELCFYEMNRRRPVVEPKKTAEGRKRRIRLLESEWRRKLDELIDSRPRGVGRDDVIDAMAACWTAERVWMGKAIRIPADPPRDSSGLRMEIVR